MGTHTHSHILSCKLCFQDRVSDFQQCYLRLWLSVTSCQIAFQLQVFTAHVYHSSDIHIVITLDPSRETVTKIERVCPGCMQEAAYCRRLSIRVCQIRILPFCAFLADSKTCSCDVLGEFCTVGMWCGCLEILQSTWLAKMKVTDYETNLFIYFSQRFIHWYIKHSSCWWCYTFVRNFLRIFRFEIILYYIIFRFFHATRKMPANIN